MTPNPYRLHSARLVRGLRNAPASATTAGGFLSAERVVMRVLASLLVLAVVAITAAPVAAAPAGPAAPISVVPWVDSPYPGKIFVAHDEWAIDDYGFQQTPASATSLVKNVATWFTGGRSGRFLVYSNFHGLTGQAIAGVMTSAGHRWTVDMTVPFTVANLMQYDAVFVGGTCVDNEVLIEFVRAGGHVFLQGGTGLGGWYGEAGHWNTFLNAFGLDFGDVYDYTRPAGTYPIQSSSPLFAGVTELYEETGNPIYKLDPSNPNVQVLVPYQDHALYATYSTRVIPVLAQSCMHLHPHGGFSMTLHGAPGFDVRAVDVSTVRLVGAAAATSNLAQRSQTPPTQALGRTALDTCKGKRDGFTDLELHFWSGQVLDNAEEILGIPLYDNDIVTLTLTGRLRKELGSTPIVGEAVVRVHGQGPRPKSTK